MTIVVLLVLAGVWAAVLVPPLLRSRAEARPGDSIGNFRRQLHVLQRTGPMPTRMVLGDRAMGAPVGAPMAGPATAPIPRLPRAAAPVASRRARTLKRRRDVLAVLLAGMTGTLVLGLLVPSLRPLLGLHVALDLVCIGYVALLVQARNATAEREMKLRFLPAAQADNVIMLRRSAN